MAVTVRRNFAPLTETVLLTREDWTQIGRMARTRIIDRTRRGLDVFHRPFVDFSEGYKKARQLENIAVATVTLELSGAMLSLIEIVPHDDRVEITFH